MKAKFLVLSLIIFSSFTHSNAQKSEKEKKGGFGRLLKTLGEAVLDEPVGTKVITGEWKDYGPGGRDLDGRSPRNHTGTFEITQPNAEVAFAYESAIRCQVDITSSTGQLIGSLYSPSATPKIITFPRAGTYTIHVVASDRMFTGTYRLTVTGASIKDIKPDIPEHWIKDKVSFGEEGGSGYIAFKGPYLPRNHQYTFEPKQGTTFDVNIRLVATL